MIDQATHLRQLVRNGDQPAIAASATLPAAVPTSVPVGTLTWGPSTLSVRPRPQKPAAPKKVELARAIAVTSGKGGVGKSNLAVNLAVCLSQLGKKVCLVDADLGLANVDVLCNITPRLTLEHVVAGRCRLSEAMILAPGGFRLIPGASGVARMADLADSNRAALIEQLVALDKVADVILIDTGAGISSNVLTFASAAHTVLVATTPEPTAVTDGYGIIKALHGRDHDVRIEVAINMAGSAAEGAAVFGRINKVSQTFLKRSLEHAATIPVDESVPLAVRHRVPFVLFAPQSPATLAVRRLAGRLIGASSPQSQDDGRGFFSRLARWLVREGDPGRRSWVKRA